MTTSEQATTRWQGLPIFCSRCNEVFDHGLIFDLQMECPNGHADLTPSEQHDKQRFYFERNRDDEVENDWWKQADQSIPRCPYCKSGPRVFTVHARTGDSPLIDFECSECDFHYQRNI